MRAVVCLGAVAPASRTYARLGAALQDEAQLILLDPLCFTGPVPAGYGVQQEIETILRSADAAPFDLIGYSVSASLALLLAAQHPDRVRTLTLVEPPWIGNDVNDSADVAFLAGLDRAMEEPPSQRYLALLAAVSPPDADPSAYVPANPPAWLVERPARFGLLWRSLRVARFDDRALTRFPHPVYLPVCGRSHPWFLTAARRLESLFPCARVDLYPELGHLDPPPSRAAARFAGALEDLWRQAPTRAGIKVPP